MPGTAPSGYQAPKTNWQSADIPLASDFNRIEMNIKAVEEGSRTIDPAQIPSGVSGTLRQFLDWFANRLKTITGKTNWYDAPDTTLAAAASHIAAAAPHSGHETPAGAQAKVDAHANLTAAHGATSAATANRIILRDANGRAQVADPSAAGDIATKQYVDAVASVVAGWRYIGACTGNTPVSFPIPDASNYLLFRVIGTVKKVNGSSGTDESHCYLELNGTSYPLVQGFGLTATGITALSGTQPIKLQASQRNVYPAPSQIDVIFAAVPAVRDTAYSLSVVQNGFAYVENVSGYWVWWRGALYTSAAITSIRFSGWNSTYGVDVKIYGLLKPT